MSNIHLKHQESPESESDIISDMPHEIQTSANGYSDLIWEMTMKRQNNA